VRVVQGDLPLDDGLGIRGRRYPLLVVHVPLVAAPDSDEVLDPSGQALQLRGLRRELRGVEQHARAAVFEYVGELRRGQTKVQRHHDGPDLSGREQQLQELGVIGEQRGHPVPALHPHAGQRVGQAVDPPVELEVVVRAAVVA
jgi:hypothetical protein